MRRARQQRPGHDRLSRRGAVPVHGRHDQSGRHRRRAASPSSTWSARRWRCWPASKGCRRRAQTSAVIATPVQTGNVQEEVPMTLGPLEYAVLGFEGNRFNGEIAESSRRSSTIGSIRLVDAVFMSKDIDGEVTVLELDNRDDPRFGAFAAIVGDLMGIFTPEDMADPGRGAAGTTPPPWPCCSSTAGPRRLKDAHHRRRRLPREPRDGRPGRGEPDQRRAGDGLSRPSSEKEPRT